MHASGGGGARPGGQGEQRRTLFRLEPPGEDDPLGIACRLVEDSYTRLEKIGQGTFGHVYLAQDRASGDLVALKKVKVESDKDGFPVTAVREMRVLQMIDHENVIRLREVVRSRPHPTNANRGSVYMVFDYAECDLAAIMADKTIELSAAHVKAIMWQLLHGIAHFHEYPSAPILHRDLKLSNLLLTKEGKLKIADMGLARAQDKNGMTNRVITLWYRPPELLLGAEVYGTEVDMWSVGCIFAELLIGQPIFRGSNEAEQLGKITRVMGCPTKDTWPNVQLLPHAHFLNARHTTNNLREHLASFDRRLQPEGAELLAKLLAMNPAKRLSAREALAHPYFTTGIKAATSLPWKSGLHELLVNKKGHTHGGKGQERGRGEEQGQGRAKRARH